MERNGYCLRMDWRPKARRPTPKSTHIRPSSPAVWSNYFVCSYYFEFSNLSNVQILLIGHVDQVFHKFCGAIPPSLMVFLKIALIRAKANHFEKKHQHAAGHQFYQVSINNRIMLYFILLKVSISLPHIFWRNGFYAIQVIFQFVNTFWNGVCLTVILFYRGKSLKFTFITKRQTLKFVLMSGFFSSFWGIVF